MRDTKSSSRRVTQDRASQNKLQLIYLTIYRIIYGLFLLRARPTRKLDFIYVIVYAFIFGYGENDRHPYL